jgi:hypothetical protein
MYLCGPLTLGSVVWAMFLRRNEQLGWKVGMGAIASYAAVTFLLGALATGVLQDALGAKFAGNIVWASLNLPWSWPLLGTMGAMR